MHQHPKHQTHRQPTEAADQPAPRHWLLPVLLVAQLMVILDITAVNIALPHMAADLHLTGSTISWTITSYSLIFGSLLMLGGRAADLLGRHRMFLVGLGVFVAASLASALAGSAAILFAARAGQGLGAAILSPAALSIITSTFHGTNRAKALAAWGAVGGAGAAIGVLVGGVLTEVADWRSIFFVNLPVAAVLFAAALRVVPCDETTPRWRGLDLPGAAVVTASLAAIVYAITQADSVGWTSLQTHLFGLGGAAGLAVFAAIERRSAAPLLKLERVADRSVAGGVVLMLATAGTIFGLFLLCSLYLQSVLGMGALATGLAFVPLAIAAGIGAHAGGHVVARRGVRAPLVVAFSLAAAGMGLLAQIDAHGSYVRDVLPGMLVAGLGLGVAVVTVSMAILSGAGHDDAGMLSGLNSTGHEIGGTLGIAIFSTIAAGASGTALGAQAAGGIATAFAVGAGLAVLAGLAAIVILPAAPHFLAKLRLNPHAVPMH